MCKLSVLRVVSVTRGKGDMDHFKGITREKGAMKIAHLETPQTVARVPAEHQLAYPRKQQLKTRFPINTTSRIDLQEKNGKEKTEKLSSSKELFRGATRKRTSSRRHIIEVFQFLLAPSCLILLV
jgi:hypothetical protein